MEVSLRKADQLANAVKELLTDNSVTQSMSVNAFDSNWKVKVTAARDSVADKVVRLTKLYRALAEIRKAVGKANAECGINDLLATDNCHKQVFNLLHTVAQAEPASDDDVIASNLAARQTKGEHDRFGYGKSFDMDINVLDAAYLERVKKDMFEIKKQRREIADELIAKNVTVKVKLPEFVIDTLRAENLI
jgi:hypothetical protein